MKMMLRRYSTISLLLCTCCFGELWSDVTPSTPSTSALEIFWPQSLHSNNLSCRIFLCLQAWSITEQHKAQTVHSFLEGKNDPKPSSKGCKEGSKHVLHKISTVASCQPLACWLDGLLMFLGRRFESRRNCQRAHLAKAPHHLHEGQGGLGQAGFSSIITQPHLPYSDRVCFTHPEKHLS